MDIEYKQSVAPKGNMLKDRQVVVAAAYDLNNIQEKKEKGCATCIRARFLKCHNADFT